MTFCQPIKHDAVRVRVRWWSPIWWCDDVARPADFTYLAWLWRQLEPTNFCKFVIGFTGRDHTFEGTKTSADIFAPDGGWQFGRTNGKRRFFLISYRDSHREMYLGWRPEGSLGWAYRKANSKQPGQP